MRDRLHPGAALWSRSGGGSASRRGACWAVRRGGGPTAREVWAGSWRCRAAGMGPPRLLLLLGCLAPLLSPPGAAEFSPSLDSDFTFTLPAGRKECFYQPMRKEASLELEYQVGRAGPRGALRIRPRLRRILPGQLRPPRAPLTSLRPPPEWGLSGGCGAVWGAARPRCGTGEGRSLHCCFFLVLHLIGSFVCAIRSYVAIL